MTGPRETLPVIEIGVMQTTRFEFGFLPQRLDMSVGDIAIETRADFDKIIDGHREWEGVEGDWIYAPLQQLTTSPGRQVRELPYTSRVFGLPKTHTISLGDANKEPGYLEFCIWTLSFFLGIRLTTTEAGFLDATPIKPSVLTDFFVSDRDLPKALALASAFWSSHQGDPTGAKRLGAAVHALFLAQSPHYLQFERFLFLYTALVLLRQ
jgi:hypothetical protein